MKKVLILGGTADAVRIAQSMSGNADVIYSLAGRTREPNLPDSTIRTGGFGGTGGLATYIAANNIDSVMDATHPYAATMAANAAAACQIAGIPRAKYLRPAWQPEEADNWIAANDYEEAARLLSDMGDRVFLSTGSQNLEAFTIQKDKFFLIRAVEPPESIPFDIYSLLLARGPFERSGETMLLSKYDIQVVVSKNSGGPLVAKLLAARDRKTPVIMIDRPEPPEGDLIESEEGVIDWLAGT